MSFSCVGLPAASGERQPSSSAAAPGNGARRDGAVVAASEHRSEDSGQAPRTKSVNPPAQIGAESPARAANPSAAPVPGPALKPQQKAPRPLTQEEITRQVMLSGRQGSWPVNQNGQVLAVERRLSESGYPDIFALFAAVPTLSDAALSTLSDFARLFKPDAHPIAFSLDVFLQQDGRLLLRHTIALGEYYVFESLRTVSIHRGANLPFAVSVAFQTADGSDDRWVIFSDAGISRFLLHETLSRSSTVEDIDGDGYLDIITRERGVEEGTGYETFLTWYKWDGNGYVEHRTTNIVRNLREFMNRSAALISEDRVDAFLSTALTKETLSALRRAGLDDSEILSRIFRPVPPSPEGSSSQAPNLGRISRVVFPDIVENPFTQNGPGLFNFPLTARFVYADDSSRFFTTRIMLSRNPFVSPEFTFAVVPPRAAASRR